LSAIGVALASRIAALAANGRAADGDVLLDVDAAAALLGVSADWLYRRPHLPFRRKIGGKVKFSHDGIQQWQKHDHHGI
jgi:hypothetical protein